MCRLPDSDLCTTQPDSTPEAPKRLPRSPSRQTRVVRGGIGSDPTFGAVVPPLYLGTNYTFACLGQPRRYDYSRTANPTRDQLADALAAAEEGVGAVITSSGMSAVLLALQLLEPCDLLVAPHDGYGGTYRLLRALEAKGAFDLRFVDLTRPEGWSDALAGSPKMVWIETPSNPLLRITDVAGLAQQARRAGALVVADNTFLSPAIQRPLTLGADLVVHSTTKYLNGHSDVVGGAVVAGSDELHDELARWANTLGLTGSPFDSYQTLRGLRSLEARMRVHQENTEALVDLLVDHPVVRRVHYPGLDSHPGHAIAARQQDGYGAILSFEVNGGLEAVAALAEGLSCFSLAESLGGFESLVAHPATMTHASMDIEARRVAGIRDDLLRLSVGIERAEDLVDDLRQGLDEALRIHERNAQVRARATAD